MSDDIEYGTIVVTFGRYAVMSEGDDQSFAWSVLRVEPGDEPEEGTLLAGFADRRDAELFAEAKFEDDDAARLDKLRDKYDPEQEYLP